MREFAVRDSPDINKPVFRHDSPGSRRPVRIWGARFNIRSIPTLALFVNGREVARQPGAMGAADIVRWTRSHTG